MLNRRPANELERPDPRDLSFAIAWPADAVRLDAYDSPAGAGPFHAKCGFSERGRVVYRNVPLTYHEWLPT